MPAVAPLFRAREISSKKRFLEIVFVTDALRRQHGDRLRLAIDQLIAFPFPSATLGVPKGKVLYADPRRALHRQDIGLRGGVVLQAKRIFTPVVARRSERD